MQSPHDLRLPAGIEEQATKHARDAPGESAARLGEHLDAGDYAAALPYAVAEAWARPTPIALVRVAICLAELAEAGLGTKRLGTTEIECLTCAIAWFDAAEHDRGEDVDFFLLRGNALALQALAGPDPDALGRAKADVAKSRLLLAEHGKAIQYKQVAELQARIEKAALKSSPAPMGRRRVRLGALVAVVLCVAALGAAAWYLWTKDPPVPGLTRELVGSLPRTTESMLILDRLHRAQNPLGPVLSGKLRWVTADEMRCDYARQYAAADLRRAGMQNAELQMLASANPSLAEAERAALRFARQLTSDAHGISDAEVAALLGHFGPDKLVGIVHVVAYANFQNRLLLALGVQIEASGPIAPTDPRLDPVNYAGFATPPRPPWSPRRLTAPVKRLEAADLQAFADLQKGLAEQRSRTPRIPMPDPSRLASLPAAMREETTRNLWLNVGMGYQPLLTNAWFQCLVEFEKESSFDHVFANSLFWLTTRTNACFY